MAPVTSFINRILIYVLWIDYWKRALRQQTDEEGKKFQPSYFLISYLRALCIQVALKRLMPYLFIKKNKYSRIAFSIFKQAYFYWGKRRFTIEEFYYSYLTWTQLFALKIYSHFHLYFCKPLLFDLCQLHTKNHQYPLWIRLKCTNPIFSVQQTSNT